MELSKLPCVCDTEQAVLWLSRACDYGERVQGKNPFLARSELLLAYIFQVEYIFFFTERSHFSLCADIMFHFSS